MERMEESVEGLVYECIYSVSLQMWLHVALTVGKQTGIWEGEQRDERYPDMEYRGKGWNGEGETKQKKQLED